MDNILKQNNKENGVYDGQYALTPEEIVRNEKEFSVPIYQRLFTWSKIEIDGLLEDIYRQYKKDHESHYYIGLITSTKNHELVDGQQRFTVMFLMGIALKNIYPEWEKFLFKGNKLRLTFTAREEDEKYLRSLAVGDQGKQEYTNNLMEKGIETITKFFNPKADVVAEQKEKEIDPKEFDQKDFAQYIYEHLAFFIQELPDGYTGRMLNKYFESMNTNGRNLENHEILKVEMLDWGKVKEDMKEYGQLVTMWNLASRMKQTVYTFYDDKARKDYEKRIENITSYTFDKDTINEESKTIIDVINSETPIEYQKNARKNGSMRSFLTFTDFLLQILYIFVKRKGEKIENHQEFFKRENLRVTFTSYYHKQCFDPKEFIREMFRYRIILDWAVIRIDGEGYYDLAMTRKEYSCLQQFEAMLYANSSRDTYYKWLPLILDEVMNNGADEDSLLKQLKEKDSDFTLNKEKLVFGVMNNNIFRRLDYYLWEEIMKDEPDYGKLFPNSLTDEDKRNLKNAVAGYKFHQYSSVEHLYPQNDKKQNCKWIVLEEDNAYNQINKMGNLALISKEFNSVQSNDSMNEKFVRIYERQISKQKLESIKLAVMYYSVSGIGEKWTPEAAEIHQKLMEKILEESKSC